MSDATEYCKLYHDALREIRDLRERVAKAEAEALATSIRSDAAIAALIEKSEERKAQRDEAVALLRLLDCSDVGFATQREIRALLAKIQPTKEEPE